LFADENEDVSFFAGGVRERLRVGMDNDAFLSAHPSIKRVSFVETSDDGFPAPASEAPADAPSNAGGGASEGDDGDDSGNDVVLPVILGAGAVIFIAGGFLAARQYSS
jgi:hypothetical protein